MKSTKCPKCGGESGYYEKRICKFTQLFDFDGTATDSTEMYGVKGGKIKRCIDCHKDITKYIDGGNS